ncbi:amino acid adenylation domain-containing protein [Lysobacter pythonis]|uniref:Amino acid adenylation domain-containing protein n=1 Tax=Solilutibacter pythonis TaxID=2483112 RepID=A0A3M2HCR1_9GAMM|nr:non-ribosomal peptide synthetase [Lysobacter pythonis]RMH87536.1 amino acid adenylation domain-containing protein [Lysobacter pythonis]
MNVSQLLIELRRRGVQLSLVDGRIQVQAPNGSLTDALRQQLQACRDELVALLAANHADIDVIPRAEDRDDAPLSPAQERLWLLQQIESDAALYLIPSAIELSGELDVQAVQSTIVALMHRHEALRTVFREHDGEVRAQRLHQWEAPFALVDLSETDNPDAHLTEHLAQECGRGIAIDREPMLRVRLFRLDTQHHVLLMLLHHIAGDARSLAVLTQEFAQGYAANLTGTRPEWAPLPLRYADYAHWQRERWASGTGERDLAWWCEQLEGLAPVHALPLDRPRPEQLDNAGARHTVQVNAQIRTNLANLAQASGTTMFVVLQAAFALLLKRHGFDPDVAFATPVAGRDRIELVPLVGFFVNTLAMRHRVDEGLTVRQWLERTREATLAAFAHQDVPFEKLIEALSPARSLSHAPLVQLMLSYQRRESAQPSLPGLTLRPWPLPQAGSKFELSLDATDGDEGIELSFEYNTRLFDAARIAAMAAHLRTLLSQMCATPDAPLHSLDMLEAERRAQLEDWEGQVRVTGERTALSSILAWAEKTPDAIALVEGALVISYRELVEQAGRYAAGLAAHGVRAGDTVALCLPRSRAMIESMLACHWLGAAYLPIDPAQTPERIGFMVEDSNARLLVSQAPLEGVAWVSVDAMASDRSVPDLVSGLDDPAYVIYTSGSTGRPKGVRITQRNLASYIEAASALYGIASTDRVLQLSTLAFDISAEEIFCTLTGGATLVLRDDEAVAGAAGFAACVQRHDISVVSLPTAFWHVLCDDPRTAIPAGSPLRLVVVGGEAVQADRLRAWREAVGSRVRLLNSYGPTEATVAASCADLTCAETVSIGRPYANTRCLVRQGSTRVPAGVVGELVLAGAGVGEGYVGHAAQGASGFDVIEGERVYRTGDRVRWQDGELIYMGRHDDQVKVQGFRVEPAEVEACLRSIPGVLDACVVCMHDPQRENRLIAYWCGGTQALDESRLRAELARQLPFYLVPAQLVRLDSLPLSRNGKLDRGALPRPHWETPSANDEPLADDQQALLLLFREVLGRPDFGPDDDFFRAGGHSLAAARLAGLIRTRLGSPMTLRALFAAPTVRALAAALEPIGADEPAPVAIARGGRLPLSPAQQRLWFLQQLDPASPSYNMPGAWRIEGPLDRAALQAAFASVFERHEVLHSRILAEDGEPYLVPQETPLLPWHEQDLRALDPQTRAQRLQACIDSMACTPFDLARDVPLRMRLLQLQDHEHVLLACLHHICADGASLGLLLEEVAAAYAALRQGAAPILPRQALQYADYAHWQQRLLGTGQEQPLLDYWRDRLHGAPTVHALPLDYPRTERPDHRGDHHAFELPVALVARLDALAAQCGVTPFLLLKTAFAAVLARYADSDEIMLGTPVSGRDRPEFESLVGFFANTLVLRERIDRDRSLPQLLEDTRDQQLADLAHQSLPFERLVEQLGLAGQGVHAPVFQILFALHETGSEFGLPDVHVSAMDSHSQTAKFDLSLHLTRRNGALSGNVEFATALFHPQTILSLAESFKALLSDLVERPDTPISHLSLAKSESLTPLSTPPSSTDLWTRFADAVAADPDAIALDHGEQRIGYAQLLERAEQCAGFLHAQGVRGGDCVGLCLARGVASITAMLACLRLGAAYLPLDPAYPRDRLALIVAEAAPRCVLLDDTGAALLAGTQASCLSMPSVRAAQHSAPPPHVDNVEAPAYVLYTSGSTGTPKGVVMPHRALTQLLTAQTVLQPRLGERLATLQFTSLNFDVSFQEIFTALTTGSRLVLVDEAQRLDLPALVDLIRASGIERLFLPVAVLGLLPSLVCEPLPSLRVITVAGEALSISPALRDFFKAHPHCRLVNHYGPTETHVVTAHNLPNDPARWPALPPIGAPLPNLRLCVRDALGSVVPPGAIGELYVSGPALALGYLGRPDFTAERFVINADGERAYRTGDRVYVGGDGELRYLSRNDGQIKLRGFRIETGDVAAQLQAVPGVSAAAVDLRRDPTGEPRLVAWLASDADAETLVEQARQRLAHTLPAFMLPEAYAVLSRLPMTVNGKLDRAKLPEPEWQRTVAQTQSPATPTEARLLPLWCELLGNEALGVTDNFFTHGGHSLLAVKLLARVREEFGAAPSLARLFSGPTVRELANQLDQKGVVNEGPVPLDREGPLPLSFGQARLWALEQLSRGAADYLIPAVVQLDGDLDSERLFVAFEAVVARHDILRTRFVEHEGEIHQVVGEHDAARAWIREDASAWNDVMFQARIADLATAPIDLGRDQPLRIALLHRAADRHVLVLVLHHIAADAASLPVLLRDMQIAYDAPGQALSPLSLQYGDYASWQREGERDGRTKADLDWWCAQLQGLPTVHGLPLDKPRPPQQSFAGGTLEYPLASDLIADVDRLAAQLQVSRYVFLQAVFVVLLHHLSEDEDVVVGTPTAGRDHPGLQDMVGFFVNTLLLRHRPTPAMRFDELVGAVAQTFTDALARQDTPFEQLVDALRPARGLAHNPLFQVMFSAQRGEAVRLRLPGIEAKALAAPNLTAKFDLSLDINDRDGGCVALWEFATDLFREHSVRQFAEHYVRLLEAVVRAPRSTLAELAWSDETPLPPLDTVRIDTVPERIRQHVSTHPDALAIDDGTLQLDYRSLWEQASAFAAALPRDGAPVAVLAPRSWQLIVGELAAWLAGRPFVPLDPAHPPSHLQAIIADAGATTLLHHPGFTLDVAVPTLAIERRADAQSLADPSAAGTRTSDLAYLIYTSGSSGAPKGVMIGHDNLAFYADAAGKTYGLGPSDRVLHLASPGFDIAIEEVWVTLAHGATVVVAGDEFLADGVGFCKAVQRHNISIASLPTAFWHTLAETVGDATPPPSWRLCILGGEAMQPAALMRWQRRFGNKPVLLNTYGPTETTVVASHYRVGSDGRIAIGRPLGNTHLRVQRSGRTVAAGLPGELIIGGNGVGRGYHGLPQLTSDAFFDADGTCWYRSGDRVRVAGDGEIEFFGRIDHQIKLRGFRVDPEQVAAVLGTHPALRQAAVIAVREQDDTWLAAYTVAESEDAAPAAEELRQWLAARLPEFMLPEAWQTLSSLPLTVNGKLDHRRLPVAARLRVCTQSRPPQGECETELAAIWCELLRLPNVGVEDNFFALGGNSLTAIRCKARIESRFNIHLDLTELFARPTIAALAECIDAGARRIDGDDLGFLNDLLDELE